MISNGLFLFEEDVSLYFENFKYFCSNNDVNIKKLPVVLSHIKYLRLISRYDFQNFLIFLLIRA
jgi:hypothetical protein